jgi:hypothetical protein
VGAWPAASDSKRWQTAAPALSSPDGRWQIGTLVFSDLKEFADPEEIVQGAEANVHQEGVK